jgi:hypothetical protein
MTSCRHHVTAVLRPGTQLPDLPHVGRPQYDEHLPSVNDSPALRGKRARRRIRSGRRWCQPAQPGRPDASQTATPASTKSTRRPRWRGCRVRREAATLSTPAHALVVAALGHDRSRRRVAAVGGRRHRPRWPPTATHPRLKGSCQRATASCVKGSPIETAPWAKMGKPQARGPTRSSGTAVSCPDLIH